MNLRFSGKFAVLVLLFVLPGIAAAQASTPDSMGCDKIISEQAWAAIEDDAGVTQAYRVLRKTNHSDRAGVQYTINFGPGKIDEYFPSEKIKFHFTALANVPEEDVFVFWGPNFGLRQASEGRVLGDITGGQKNHYAVRLKTTGEVTQVNGDYLYQAVDAVATIVPTPDLLHVEDVDRSLIARAMIVGQKLGIGGTNYVVEYNTGEMEVLSAASLFKMNHALVGKKVRTSDYRSGVKQATGKIIAVRSLKGEAPEIAVELANGSLILRARANLEILPD